MNLGSVAPRMPPNQTHVHLVEVMPDSGHGPLWLGYLIDALAPVVGRLSVTFPDLDEYQSVIRPRATTFANLATRPFQWQNKDRTWRPGLSVAAGLRADLTLLTFLDRGIKKYRGDLRRKLGTPIWGIWFLPNPRKPVSRFDLRRLYSGTARGRYRDQQVLRHVPDWLSGVFVLDELLKERITPRSGLEIHVLPDPWPTRPTVSQEQARARLGLPAGKTIFLHFGVANPRKGLTDAIRAWEQLSDESDAVLFRAGLTLNDEVRLLAPLMDRGRALLRNERIPDAEVDLCFRACDWVLMPYRQHEGSSGLLSAAAASCRPVIASDYSVIGKRVRAANLGLLFPHLSVDGLANTVRTALRTPVQSYADSLQAYAASHDIEHFTNAIRENLGIHASDQPGVI